MGSMITRWFAFIGTSCESTMTVYSPLCECNSDKATQANTLLPYSHLSIVHVCECRHVHVTARMCTSKDNFSGVLSYLPPPWVLLPTEASSPGSPFTHSILNNIKILTAIRKKRKWKKVVSIWQGPSPWSNHLCTCPFPHAEDDLRTWSNHVTGPWEGALEGKWQHS